MMLYDDASMTEHLQAIMAEATDDGGALASSYWHHTGAPVPDDLYPAVPILVACHLAQWPADPVHTMALGTWLMQAGIALQQQAEQAIAEAVADRGGIV